MALTHLADTSVLKRLARPEVRRVVEPMLMAGELGRAGICDLEVGYSARSAKEWDAVITDLLIAAAAEATNLVVLHYDGDFDRIAAVTGQPCQWVVPAGTVD